jgi:uncharacterized membrane protein YqjE
MAEDEKQTALEAAEKVVPPASTTVTTDGRIDRIVQETKHLSDDLMEWVNLRLRLVQLDVQELIDNELDFVFSGVIVLAMIMVAFLLASIGLAFVIGDWLGESWYGFGIMTVVYLVAAFIVSRVRPRLAAGMRASWVKERREHLEEAGNSDE